MVGVYVCGYSMNMYVHTFAYVHGDQIKLLGVLFCHSVFYFLETGYLTEPGVRMFSPIRLAASNPSGPPTSILWHPVLMLLGCVWSGLYTRAGESELRTSCLRYSIH